MIKTINTADLPEPPQKEYIPTVTIGMPVYNGEPYIHEALDSLLAQTYSDFQLIISDNASTDNTQTICEQYAKKDQRIKYIRQKSNIGMNMNFQFVLEQAKSSLFMWCAADDYPEKDWLESLVKSITPDDFSVMGEVVFIDKYGNIVGKVMPKSKKKNALARLFFSRDSDCTGSYIYGLIRRELALDLFPILKTSAMENYGQDILFAYLALQRGNLRKVSPSKIYYRIHDTNTSLELYEKVHGSKSKINTQLIKRILYRAHPWFFYTEHYKHTPKNKRLLIALLMPLKYLYAQFDLWFRCAYFLIMSKPYRPNKPK